VIRQWVTNGAPKPAAAQSIEAAAKSVQRFEVATTSPDSNAVVSEDVSQIVLSFNGDIDSTLINNTTVTLDSVAGSAPGSPGSPVLMTAAVPAGNAATIVIKPQAPLTNGIYRVTLQGSLANMDAQALGTAVSFTFTVDALK
jgi:methionine-rich copper-binding protein CopC